MENWINASRITCSFLNRIWTHTINTKLMLWITRNFVAMCHMLHFKTQNYNIIHMFLHSASSIGMQLCNLFGFSVSPFLCYFLFALGLHRPCNWLCSRFYLANTHIIRFMFSIKYTTRECVCVVFNSQSRYYYKLYYYAL